MRKGKTSRKKYSSTYAYLDGDFNKELETEKEEGGGGLLIQQS